MGQYFGVDPVVLRVVYLLFAVCTLGVFSIILYVLLIFVIPLEPDAAGHDTGNSERAGK